MLDDGVYGLVLESRLPDAPGDASERSDGLVVLRAGRVLGSDRNGGVFRGRYHFDAACGETHFEVQLAIPPNGVLVTGFAAGPEGALVDVSGRFKQSMPVLSSVVDLAGVPVAVELQFMGRLGS